MARKANREPRVERPWGWYRAVDCGDEVRRLGPDESVHIPLGAAHRLETTGDDALHVIEVQSGDDFREDDIVRLDGACGTAEPSFAFDVMYGR